MNNPSEAVTDPYSIEANLLYKTPEAWAKVALSDLQSLMSDHVWCERKASGTCLSLLAGHIDFPILTEPMIRLAREELEHFHVVYNLMRERGMTLLRDHPNTYVNQLRSHIRSAPFQLQDRLLVSSLIEARSSERLGLIARFVEDDALKNFYTRLKKAEARHTDEFYELSQTLFGAESTKLRMAQLMIAEAESIQAAGFGARVH